MPISEVGGLVSEASLVSCHPTSSEEELRVLTCWGK